jgi:integrase
LAVPPVTSRTVLRSSPSASARALSTIRAAEPAKGLDVAGGVHALRHFYASTLISAGCTVKEVQERLGHRSASMTLDVYSHLWPSDGERTRTVTDSALGKVFRGKIDDHVTTESTTDDNAPDQSAS